MIRLTGAMSKKSKLRQFLCSNLSPIIRPGGAVISATTLSTSLVKSNGTTRCDGEARTCTVMSNIMGTKTVIMLAESTNVLSFVMASTNKINTPTLSPFVIPISYAFTMAVILAWIKLLLTTNKVVTRIMPGLEKLENILGIASALSNVNVITINKVIVLTCISFAVNKMTVMVSNERI